MIKLIATTNAPYDWPMNVDPLFEQKTTDMFVDLDTPSSLPSLWSGEYVDFNVTVAGDAVLPNLISITSVESFTVNDPDLSIEKIGTTSYRVRGFPTSFKNEYYEFVFDDNTIRKLPPRNKENWKAVIKWNAADTPWERVNIFTTVVKYNGVIDGVPVVNGELTSMATQYVYWSWEKGLLTLQNVIKEGKV
jgi:hypothetical protein